MLPQPSHRGLPASLKECNKAIHQCAQTSHWKQASALLQALGEKADLVTFNSAINACSKASQWQQALVLLSQLERRKLQASHISYNTSMDACARDSHWREALYLLRQSLSSVRTGRKELFALNTALSAGARGTEWRVAIGLLEQIKSRLIEADEVTFKWLQNACGEHQWKIAVAAMISVPGMFSSHSWLPPFGMAATAQWPEILRRLQHAVKVDAVSISSISSTLAQSQEWRQSLSSLRLMVRKEIREEPMVSTAVVVSLGKGLQWQHGMAYLQRANVGTVDAYTMSASILSCGGLSWQSAMLLLHEAHAYKVKMNVMIYGAAMSACEQSGCWQMALGLLSHMGRHSIWDSKASLIHFCVAIEANLVVYNTALSACGTGMAWQKALQLFEDMDCHFHVDVVTTSSLMHACVLGSQWPLALKVLEDLPGRSLQPTSITFGTAIGACEDEGHWQLAIHLLEEQQRSNLPVSTLEWNSAISACEKGLAWQEGLHLFRQTEADSITYSASIRLCERASLWQNAVAFLRDMQNSQMLPPLVTYLDAARACAAADVPAAMALAMEMTNPVDRLWCLAQVFGSDPLLIQTAFTSVSLTDLVVEDLLRFCSSMSLLGIHWPPMRLEEILRRRLKRMSLQQLNVATLASHAFPNILPMIQTCCRKRLKTADADASTFEEDAESILGILWVSRQLNCNSRRMQKLVSAWIQFGAARMDQQAVVVPVLRHGKDRTLVVQDFPDRAVLMKPSGWDVYDQCVEGKQLCNYARDVLGEWPIFQDLRHRYGFLHRLDVPSSGLVVVAKTYQSFYDLQAWKYVVMAHGWLHPRVCEANLYWFGNGPTIAGGRGKFSCTKVINSLHLCCGGAAFSLLQIHILTGRRHQIRSHLSHCGYPSVSDGLYAATDVYIGDLQICASIDAESRGKFDLMRG
eukprot:symbB.v1.2.011642.t1/scaffold789.1/size230748/3